MVIQEQLRYSNAPLILCKNFFSMKHNVTESQTGEKLIFDFAQWK